MTFFSFRDEERILPLCHPLSWDTFTILTSTSQTVSMSEDTGDRMAGIDSEAGRHVWVLDDMIELLPSLESLMTRFLDMQK